jgi:hypothetical protein
MQYLDLIIKIAAVLTAAGVIITAIVKLFRFIKKIADTMNQIQKSLKSQEEHSYENYMSLLRLTIMSSEMPIGERIVAGHKYIANGGNGEVKKYLNENFNMCDTVDTASHYKK